MTSFQEFVKNYDIGTSLFFDILDQLMNSINSTLTVSGKSASTPFSMRQKVRVGSFQGCGEFDCISYDLVEVLVFCSL